MTVLDRTVLGGQLRGTLELMRVLQQAGERCDSSRANQLLGHRQQPCSSGASSGTTKDTGQDPTRRPDSITARGLCSSTAITSTVVMSPVRP